MTKKEIEKFKKQLQIYFDSTKNDRGFVFYEERVFFGNEKRHCLHLVRFEMAEKMHVNHYLEEEEDEIMQSELFEYNGRKHEIQCIRPISFRNRKEQLYSLEGDVLQDMFMQLGYVLVKVI